MLTQQFHCERTLTKNWTVEVFEKGQMQLSVYNDSDTFETLSLSMHAQIIYKFVSLHRLVQDSDQCHVAKIKMSLVQSWPRIRILGSSKKNSFRSPFLVSNAIDHPGLSQMMITPRYPLLLSVHVRSPIHLRKSCGPSHSQKEDQKRPGNFLFLRQQRELLNKDP